MRRFWRKWSYEIPLLISDALWDVLVVQFAAFLDRLTLRQIVAFIPVLILILAYAHSIPIPPELMLVGDVLAYIDIFSVILLLGVISRIAAVLPVVCQAAERIAGLTSRALVRLQRLDFRHPRRRGAGNRQRPAGPRRNDDGEYPVAAFAWT